MARTRVAFVYVGTVVLVAAFVAWFLMPRLPNKDHTNWTASIENLKIQVQALMIYSQQNDGKLPPAEVWMDASNDGLKNKGAFVDPLLLDRRPDQFGYAFFEPLSGVQVFSVLDPDSVPLTFVSTDLSRNAHGSLEKLDFRVQKDQSAVSFLDGHVSAVDRPWPLSEIEVKISEWK